MCMKAVYTHAGSVVLALKDIGELLLSVGWETAAAQFAFLKPAFALVFPYCCYSFSEV